MRRRPRAILIAALAAVVVTLVLDRRDDAPSSGARVLRVIDGDTIAVSVGGGREQSVRLLGIDTPETHRPGTPIECGGPEASANMRKLPPPRPPVPLATDPRPDRTPRPRA